MSGETDLVLLLRYLEPRLDDGEVVFVSTVQPLDVPARAVLHEDEGITHVVARADADRLGLTYDFVGAWITLAVSSALDAVGLTAAVATALADAGISANVLAGYHHDHLVVPHARAADAVAVLKRLAG